MVSGTTSSGIITFPDLKFAREGTFDINAIGSYFLSNTLAGITIKNYYLKIEFVGEIVRFM